MMGRFVAWTAVAVACVLGARAAGAGEVDRRKQRQQNRIAAGVESGRLSPAEAGRLERQEAAVDREEHAMRDANGGRLMPGERRVVNRQQNRLSRRIFRQKHDGNDR
jgi:hypothetical protein